MPALQVRDMPEDLYAKVRSLAETEHRSIAQQTIVALERMVNTENAETTGAPYVANSYVGIPANGSAQYAMERKKRRKAVLQAIHACSVQLPADAPDPVRIIREGRDERERGLDVLSDQLHEEGIV